MAELCADTRTPDTSMSDDMNHVNPAVTDALIQLTLGGLPTGRQGYPLHARLRYFDPARRRAGLPEDVAALVERMTEDSVTVTLVNLSPVHERTVIVQGGAYAEHQLTTVRSETSASSGSNGSSGSGGNGGNGETTVDAPYFAVRLAPGAGERLTIGQRRFDNQPTMAFPWV
jgi:hypothetical protein